jgi:uncharacterized protein YkwD
MKISYKGLVMAEKRRSYSILTASLLSLLLAACGGGGGSNEENVTQSSVQDPVTEPNAPGTAGNMATDGFNWFNFRRQQIGLAAVTRNGIIDAAAQGHSDYQKVNDTITHDQTPGNAGFTGATVSDRLQAAGYRFNAPNYAYGEVISATGHTSGFTAAESLITAIYHRYVIFEPQFKEAGSATATVPSGYTYFTTNFAVNGLGLGLGSGGFVTYPFANQQNVQRNFFSDQEIPDPMPDQNEVGYPVSVHTDIEKTLTVQSFTLRRNGTPVDVRLLSNANDPQTPRSAASIVPISVLAGGTTYEAQFNGTVDGVPVSRTWTFTTR